MDNTRMQYFCSKCEKGLKEEDVDRTRSARVSWIDLTKRKMWTWPILPTVFSNAVNNSGTCILAVIISC